MRPPGHADPSPGDTASEDHPAGPPAARTDWEERIGRRGADMAGRAARLTAPTGLRAVRGRGQVTLHWDPVPGAAGYLVYRSDRPEGPFGPLDHGGGDVLAIPNGPYGDPAADGAAPAYYKVSAVAGPNAAGPQSAPATAGPPAALADGTPILNVTVGPGETRVLPRPWEPMIGSEHLSYLLSADRTGGRVIGDELREALRIAHDDLGVRAVRAHGILCDDLGVYREVDGSPSYDFSRVDEVYDLLMSLGLRPVVELSFMPADLARDPGKTVFTYGAIISPPRDWDRWAELVTRLVRHLAERYGLAELRESWAFEVWNEPNLDVFWSGTPEEYFRLYDVSAEAIRAVDPGLRVGGPSSAAAEWVDDLLAHVTKSGAPVDFVSTHVYGNAPLDLRPVLARYGIDAPLWWTEWGPTPTHFHPVGDTVFAAAFLLRGVRSALGRIGALSHWVASDHFEELGPPPALFHGGFGLLSVGNLRKPRFWALAMLARLGSRELAVDITGDGAWSTIEALATRDFDGRIGVLVWNAPLDQHNLGNDRALDREIRLRVKADAPRYAVTHHRIDAGHSNVVALWNRLGGSANWPDDAQWRLLADANVLEELTAPVHLTPAGGDLCVDFTLPMPAVSYLELVPDVSLGPTA
jgi:xylan 1,4-beta-xylosidase